TPTLAVGQAEAPVVYVRAPAIPLIGPRKDEHPGATGTECGSHLPRETLRLPVLSVPNAIEPKLAHEERPVSRHVLKTGEVGLETFLRLQVDVEADKIKERQIEILRRGVVDVGHEGIRILRLDHVIEVPEIPLDAMTPQPAHRGPRYLVAERVAEDGRMPGT